MAGGAFDCLFLSLSFFPLDVLDEIWDVIESVSEGFLTYASVVVLLLFLNVTCFMPVCIQSLAMWSSE